jgi:hypothetical protein
LVIGVTFGTESRKSIRTSRRFELEVRNGVSPTEPWLLRAPQLSRSQFSRLAGLIQRLNSTLLNEWFAHPHCPPGLSQCCLPLGELLLDALALMRLQPTIRF